MYLNDTTTWDQPDTLASPETKALKVFVVTVVSVAVTTTNIFNLTTLRKTQQIPEIAKLCLLNLSIADLTSGIICLAPSVASAILDSWPYGEVWCQIAGVFHGTCCSVSIWSLSVVSVDRYVAVKYPLRYHTLVTTRRCLRILVFLWSFAFATFLLPVVISANLIYYQYISDTLMCGMYWDYTWLCIVSGLYVPVASAVIIVYTSAGIIKETLFRNNRVTAITTQNTDENSKKLVHARAVKILCISSGMYFAAWGPYVLTELPSALTSDLDIPGELRFWFLWLANTNSCMNVFIYCMIYKSFRQRARILLHRMFCCRIPESQSVQIIAI